MFQIYEFVEDIDGTVRQPGKLIGEQFMLSDAQMTAWHAGLGGTPILVVGSGTRKTYYASGWRFVNPIPRLIGRNGTILG